MFYPVSDKSSDVIAALKRKLEKEGAEIHLNEPVEELLFENGRVCGVILKNGHRSVRAGAVIAATGGLSYPATGSTGEGHRMAAEAGHTITPLQGSLVPLREKGKSLRPDAGAEPAQCAFNGL